MRYRLPDALGGGECVLHTPFRKESLYCRVTVGEGDEAFSIDLLFALLTAVEPPLPEEPPVGAYRIGSVLCMRVSSQPDKCWVYQTADEMFDEMTFAGLCSLYGTGIVPLVPDPFAEPVALPWKCHGIEVQQTHDDGEPGRNVFVSTKGARHGFAHLKPADARCMARALMAVADAAEATPEPLPAWERELLEGQR